MTRTAQIRARKLSRTSRWREPFTVLQTNLQLIDANLDVEAAVDAVIDYGADTWLLNAGGISSFYPTDLPFQTRNPHLLERPSGDLFGDGVVAASRRGVKVIARFDMSKVSGEIAARHPEWLYRTPDGQPQVYSGLSSTCPSAAYYQERVFDVIDEVIDRYEIDGIFFNWFNFNERDYDEVVYPPCHCDACIEGFRGFSGGEELPTGMDSPSFGRWRAYTAATLAALTSRIVDHVDARGRDIGVVLRRGAPIEYLEGNNAFRAMPGKELWPYATAESVSAIVTSEPDAAVLVNCVAFIDSSYRMGSEQPEHFAQHILQTISRGGNPSAYYFGAPGRLPMENAIALGRVVTRHRAAHRDLYAELRPAARVAIVRPDYSSAPPGGYWQVVEEFRGAYQALVEGHVPFDVIPVDRLEEMGESGALERFSLVVLPDLGSLRGAGAAVDAYVAGGGRLLITGSSGMSADGEVELISHPAKRAAGPAVVAAQLRGTYATDASQPHAAENRFAATVLPIFGSRQVLTWKDDVTAMGNLLTAAPFGPPELAYGHTISDEPGAVRRAHGRGCVVAVPWTVGRTYREYAKTDVRDHLLRLVTEIAECEVTAEAVPEQVEIVVGRAGERLVLHLVNHSGLRRRSYGPHVPIASVRLRVANASGGHAIGLVGESPLDVTQEGEDLLVTVPRLELFEVVVITRP